MEPENDLPFVDDSEIQYEDDEESSSNDSSVGTKVSHDIAHKDIQLMNVVRAIAILIVLTITTVSAEAVFIIARGAEEDNFTDAFYESTRAVIDEFYSRIDQNLWSARSVALDLSISAESDADQEWPFVTFANFNARTESALRLSFAESVSLSPLLSDTDRKDWEAYVAKEQEGTVAVSRNNPPNVTSYYVSNRTIDDGIYRFVDGTSFDVPTSAQVLSPIRHIAPLHENSENLVGVFFDEWTTEIRQEGIEFSTSQGSALMTRCLYRDTNQTDFLFHSTPFSSLIYPVLNGSAIVATIGMEVDFLKIFQGILENNEEAIDIVVENQCGGLYTFKVAGPTVSYLREGRSSETISEVNGYIPQSTSYEEFLSLFTEHSAGNTSDCGFRITIYATDAFADQYLTNLPNVYRAIVLGFFVILLVVLVGYDCMIERRQHNVVVAAERSDAVVRSLFPTEVRNRLYEEAKRKEEERKHKLDWKTTDGKGFISSPKTKMKDMAYDPQEGGDDNDDPIADLYPNTTILFADLAGFTAWSSEREPTQVFKLLETIYRSMDKLAKKLGVFKVETIGDCYVAATGLPESQPDHATRMVRFARASLVKVNALTRTLEAELGPGTADLAMRVGLHSGSVTAGVLRGQKARFQLFGDTMNMASRMESTGERNKVQISQETAEILIASGKTHWTTPRADKVFVKGKGDMQTYWLLLGSRSGSTASSQSDETAVLNALTEAPQRAEPKRRRLKAIWAGTELEAALGATVLRESLERLVDWNAEVLLTFLKRIMVKREALFGGEAANTAPTSEQHIETGLVLDEVQMVIKLPGYNEVLGDLNLDENIQLHSRVVTELNDYVACIASGYRRNAFHSFEHASHVILSANKLLKRIINPDEVGPDNKTIITPKELHDHTYGIGSDPLSQFAVVFAALIHDVGHTGHPSNDQLSHEQPDLADMYMNKSVAEQYSVDVAWKLLMLPHFRHLRACIYKDHEECLRFRHLVVNSVMATDIFDPDLKSLRDNRWSQSFTGKRPSNSNSMANHKATIVLEHLIQASDVSHTMQHWHVFVKWNKRLFQEMYTAFRTGRRETDPGEGWYEGELWFFDNYVIPLAKKLEECGVFGVSSAEYLQYALHNRSEWETKGRKICEEMRQEALRNTEGMASLCDETCSATAPVEENDMMLDSDYEDDDDSVSYTAPSVSAQWRRSSNDLGGSENINGMREVQVPAGTLGLVVETHETGGPVIHMVSNSSPVRTQLFANDQIIEIDGISITSLSTEAITALMDAKMDQPKSFIVQRVDMKSLPDQQFSNFAGM